MDNASVVDQRAGNNRLKGVLSQSKRNENQNPSLDAGRGVKSK